MMWDPWRVLLVDGELQLLALRRRALPRLRARPLDLESQLLADQLEALPLEGHPQATLVFEADLEADFEDSSTYAETRHCLGQAYFKTGDKKSASEQYEILKTLDEELAQELLDLMQK